MKCIIAGSRSVNRLSEVERAVHESGWADDILEVVSGGASGADLLGEMWATERNRSITRFHVTESEWKIHGRAAGPIRNRRMAEYADRAVIVWDGKSRGSKNMIWEMERLEKPVFVHVLGVPA